MDGYHQYQGGAHSIHVARVDDKVTISVIRDNDLLVQIETTKAGAIAIAQKILGVLS